MIAASEKILVKNLGSRVPYRLNSFNTNEEKKSKSITYQIFEKYILVLKCCFMIFFLKHSCEIKEQILQK